MPSNPPILIAPTEYNPELIGSNPGEDSSLSLFRLNGQTDLNSAVNKPRFFTNGSTIWTILWDGWGDEWDGGLVGTRYQQNTWSAWKSIDGGSTWAAADWVNRIGGGRKYYTSDGYDAVVQVGTKLWLFFDYSEHIDLDPTFPGVDFTGQFDRIHAVPFDMAAETWGTVITAGGPIWAPPGTALSTQHVCYDACYRGSDEIVVFHGETDDTVSPQRAMYSIFNINTLTWSSLNTVVFTSTTATDVSPSSCAFDGTYTHFIALAGPVQSSTSSKLHRTLTGSTLGTVGNMFAAYPGGYPSLGTYPQSYFDYAIVFGGEVIVVQVYRGLDQRYAALTDQALVMHSPAGVAAPTWTCTDLLCTVWDAANGFNAAAQTGAPLLAESGGDLYAISPGAIYGEPGLSPETGQYFIHTQKYAGSGVWGAPVQLWSWREAFTPIYPPSGGTGTFPMDELRKLAAIGNLGGTGTAAIGIGCSIVGYPRIGYPADVYEDSAWWIREGADECCCSDGGMMI